MGKTLVCCVALLVVSVVPLAAQDGGFKGKIRTTLENSEEYWPQPVTAGEVAPTVLIWLIEDVYAVPFRNEALQKLTVRVERD